MLMAAESRKTKTTLKPSPLTILREATRAVPAVKYALGVAGIAAAVAIIAGFHLDYKVAVLGTILMFGLMFCLVVFSWFASHAADSIKPLALFLSWTFVLLVSATSLCMFTSFFFSFPRSLSSYVEGFSRPQPSPTVTAETSPRPSSTMIAQEYPTVSPTPRIIHPAIHITVVPAYDPVGGPNSKAHIAGEVKGVIPENYRVVIYALTIRTWYVQPTTAEPLTRIQPDGTWSANIQTGIRYAALLVPPDYNPLYTTSDQPNRMKGVVVATEVEGRR
jgi:hypothetical protein